MVPKKLVLNVRFGSKADIQPPPTDVRFTPKSGHWNSVPKCLVTLERFLRRYEGVQIIKPLQGVAAATVDLF